MGPLVLTLASCSIDGLPSPFGDDDDELDDGTADTPAEKPANRPVDQPPCVPVTGLTINEVSASNTSVLVDLDGDSVDWVELYNDGTETLSLDRWTLSDDSDEPAKWVFPALQLAAGEYLVVYASGKDTAATVATWDTRVDVGDAWKYREVTAEIPGWTLPDYDDDRWAEGPSGFGREDGDDATEITAGIGTVYLRTTLEITDVELADLASAVLHVDYDDAFVAYLNGVEIARGGIGAVGIPPAWDSWAEHDHEAVIPTGGQPEVFDVPSDLLNVGENTLAIEGHNRSAESLDLSVVPFLSFGFRSIDKGRQSVALTGLVPEIHTNFSLAADGEHVRLYDPSGCEADDIEPGQMFADQSYGRRPDGGPDGYFMEPTPGAANLTESRPGFAATPVFSPPPGHFPGGTDVTIAADPGASVHVAFEGAEPRETDPQYDGPIATGDDGEAVVVRARAWQDGLWPSRIATGTWLLRDPGTLPVVSLVTDPPNLWDDEIGIYTFGSDYERIPPYHGANFQEDWERPVHMEEWEPDGTPGFSVDAGIAIHGGHSRLYAQKSLMVDLDSGYGDASIEHDLFPGLGITSFTSVLLRSGGNDWHGCWSDGCSVGAHLRDPLMHRLTAGQDLDVLAWRPAEVYLNGVYWGLYHLNEWPNAGYVESHHGVEDIDLLESDSKVNEGDGVAYADTLNYLRTHDLSETASYAHVKTLIDTDELATYLAFEIFYDNTDWPGNNIKYWRPRTPDGRWRWMLYDTDFGLGPWGHSPSNDSLGMALDPAGPDWPNPPWSTELFRMLFQSPEFTETFINRYADYLNTLLLPEVTRQTLHQTEAEIAPGMPRQVERWGTWSDGTTTRSLDPGTWEVQIGNIDEWLGERPPFAREHIVTNFGLAGTWTLSLQAEPAGAGTFFLTAVEVEGPFEGTYFQGVPVTVTAIPAAGHTFREWSDPSLPADPTVTLAPTQAVGLVARFD